MGAFLYKYSLIIALVGLFVAGLLLSPTAAAQSGCTGDPCLFETPTPTATGTAQPTPQAGTPTPVPMAPAIPFPQPNYSAPTSIPAMTFPNVPNALDITLPDAPEPLSNEPIPLPSPLAHTFNITAPSVISMSDVVFTGTTPISLTAINTTLSISYSAPLTLSNSGGLTGTAAYTGISGMVDAGTGFLTDTISYTTWLSGEIESINYTESFTIETAPAWYAPNLPRPMADVGWTFETMQSGIDNGKRYSLTTWASFTGYIASLPVQLIKAVFELFRFLGAFGLFAAWLLIMLPLVLFFKIFEFLKGLVVRLFNFILDVIGFILQLIKLLPFV